MYSFRSTTTKDMIWFAAWSTAPRRNGMVFLLRSSISRCGAMRSTWFTRPLRVSRNSICLTCRTFCRTGAGDAARRARRCRDRRCRRRGQSLSDLKASVTNGYGQTHDFPNLFIAGSGLFPTSRAVNPTFTIHALALRAAEFIQSLSLS